MVNKPKTPAFWERRCIQLTKVRNDLQTQNRKLLSCVAKVSYLIKKTEQEDINHELRLFYLYLEKKDWVKPRNTFNVVKEYQKKRK